MALSVKLVQGSDYLDLTTGRYRYGLNFVPPAVLETPQFARGSSLNRLDGGALISLRASNRTLEFELHVEADSEAETRRALQRLDNFLRRIGGYEPLYLEVRAHADTPAPIWGQFGAPLRYEIVHGQIGLSSHYGIKPLREGSLPRNTLRLTVKPYALGTRQVLATATGGIVEADLARVDGTSLGPIIAEATTNKLADPLFHNGSSSAQWAPDANLIIEEDTTTVNIFDERRFVFTSTGAANNGELQSINVGNTNSHTLSCYVRRPDGEAVTSDDMQLYYNSAQTTVFTLLPGTDGWYRASVTLAGINASTSTGFIVKDGRAVEVTGLQMEEKAYATPLCHGEALGCAWTGSDFTSTSSRTAATLTLPIGGYREELFTIWQGAVRLVWQAPFANTHPNDLFLWKLNNMAAHFESSDDKFYFTDGTNTISTAAQTFGAGDLIALHFVYGPSGLAIYKNGISAASGGSYDPTDAGSNALYIGSDSTPANQGYGPFLDFAIFGLQLDSSEIAADYANMAQILADTEQISPIPWRHGGALTNCPDSNEVYIQGIPGSESALTEVFFRCTDINTAGAVYLSHNVLEAIVPLDLYQYRDFSGTVVAGACGGQVQATSVNTAEVAFASTAVKRAYYRNLSDREFFIAARIADAGANLQAAMRITFGNLNITTEFKNWAADATYRTFLTPSLKLPRDTNDMVGQFGAYQFSVSAVFKRSVAGAANVSVDYLMLMARPLVRMRPLQTIDGGLNAPAVHLRGSRAVGIDGGVTASVDAMVELVGDLIELEPGRINLLVWLIGNETVANDTTDTLSLGDIWITPRWGVL